CAPVSFWNFCSAAAVDWNANTPSNAVVAAASCFFVVLPIDAIALLMTTDTMPGNAYRSSGPGPQSCGPALKSLGRRSALRARRLVEGGAQSLGKLHGVVIGPEVHEEQPRLLVEHVAMDRRHLDAIRPQRLDHRIHLVRRQHEVAGDSGLAAAGGLEVDGGGEPQWPDGSKLRSALIDGAPAGRPDLIHAAHGLPLGADDLIELGGVEVDRGRAGRSRRRGERIFALRQPGADRRRELPRTPMPADVHVERRGVGAQHVVVHGGDLDAGLDALGHDWSDSGS